MNRRTLLQALAMPGLAALGLPRRSATAGADDSPAAALEADAAFDPFRDVTSKKGLQVQMADDAIALGVRHATLNVDLSGLIAPATAADSDVIVHRCDGHEFRFRRAAVLEHDRQIRQLSDHGVLVYLILLAYRHADERVNRLLIHPRYDPAAPNRLGAFNTVTVEGRTWLAALGDFLAGRWSLAHGPHGRVVGYIVGNEVNSHWYWSNRGRASLAEFAADYEPAVRLVHAAVRRHAVWPRVYLSLEHHWTMRFAAADDDQAFPARPFLHEFARLARERGDYDWHVAFHPYPENLFEPRFWLDRTATDADDTPRITLRNLPVLVRFLEREEMLHQGRRRRVILSEQGFHTSDDPTGEEVQAAAYCLAHRLVRNDPGIDAFILHRHVDHAEEGGLRLGLWTRRSDSIATPDRPKRSHACFRAADTPAENDAFAFAPPIVGHDAWAAAD
ncbi:MAG: DUF5722 domain-containing protein [Planctomycetota bacterium]